MKVRAVNYTITYSRPRATRYVWSEGKLIGRVTKKQGHWYAGSRYHKSMRDAIIYLAYGV